ncbi:MAG: glycoside hydrolase N-terminal domain-containing protein [Clostridiales bacterium]|nr:glycoside hydrolase N-terminal domain-containing protein [Clostridiales bacterium]
MASARKPKNVLKFSQPSSWWGSQWREAIPLGNGVLGAAVYGGAAEDVIMLTHGDLWWQGKDSVLQDVSDKVKDVRKKIDDGDFLGAEKILSTELIKKGYRPQLSYPLPLLDFVVKMQLDHTVKEYSRELDMESAEASVTFKDGATRFTRNTFVSRARDIIVYEITRTGQKNINCFLKLETHDKFNARTPVAISAMPENVNVKSEKYWLYYSARSSSGSDFGAVAQVKFMSGNQEPVDGGLKVTGADRIIVIIKPFIETPHEKAWKEGKAAIADIKLPYDKLLKEHQTLHQKLFFTAELDFNCGGREDFVDDSVVKTVKSGETDPALLEKLWAYGRYLMITGSRPDARPFAPYGLWCGDYKAVLAQINAAGSLQAAYDMTQTGNLGEFTESVFSLYEGVMQMLKYNASRLYGCRGIFVPYTTSPSTGYPGEVYESMIHFTGVAGWLGNLFYDYALYTDDQKFLKNRALPFMKEAATFYEEFFKLVLGENAKQDYENKYYESSPSYSPFSTPGNLTGSGEEHAIARNATVDFAIARNLLKNLIEGSESANMNKSEVMKWKDMLKKLPPFKYNPDGTLSEYIDDKCTDNPESPSLALYYPVYPDYRSRDNLELNKALINTARKKSQTARSNMNADALARYAQVFARLGDGDNVYDCINALVRGMAMNNLIFADADWRGMGSGKKSTWAQPVPYVNLIVTGAIQESLVQSTPDTISLLPALCAGMGKGMLTGFQTRAKVEVSSLEWDVSRGTLVVKLKAKRATKIDVQFPKTAKAPKKVDAEKFDDTRGLLMGLKLAANKPVTVEVKF